MPLTIDNDAASDWWGVIWGIEQDRGYTFTSSLGSGALYYEAESRTAMGGSAIAAGPSGASGAGSNVMRNTALPTNYLAILSTQATAAGAHLSHVGSFHAYARVQVPTANTGLVTVALEWSEGDFLRYSRNAATTIPSLLKGRWLLVDLGLVMTNKVLSGTQRWEGRIVAKSTVVGDDIDVDYLILVPVAEGSGIASAVSRSFTPTSYVGEDHFTATTAGNALNARVAPTGGTWATSGDATDFVFYDDFAGGGERISRTAVSSTSGRFAILGSTNYTNVDVGVGIVTDYEGPNPGSSAQMGVIARWTDASNHLRAVAYESRGSFAGRIVLEIHEILAGTKTVIATLNYTYFASIVTSSTSDVYRVELTVNTGGQAVATLFLSGTAVATTSTTRASLATGGTLATGKPGIFDFFPLASPAAVRAYDNFLVATIPADAGVFAGQSIEIRSDRVLREDSGGTLWAKPGSYVGDYLRVPPSAARGPERARHRQAALQPDRCRRLVG